MVVKQLEPQFQKDFSAGMVTNINENIIPRNAVALGLNVDFDNELGSAMTRLGTGIVGSQLASGAVILGLHQHVDDANQSNNKLFACVNASGSATFTAAVDNVITDAAHGLINGDLIWVSNSGGALPAGLTASTNYYVISATTDTFKVSTTFGGTEVDITDTGTGTHTWTHKGARIYDVVAGTASAGGFTQSTKMRFLTFGGATLAINGVDAERSYTAAGGWITTGGVFDLADYPGANSCEVAVEFLDRVYTLGDSSEPDRLHYSDVLTSGVIAWSLGFVDIEPEDGGGALKALGKVPGFLIVFKERSMKRFNLDSGADPESLVDIGTPSPESVISKAGLCAFFSASSRDTQGFYITNGARPVPISHLRAKSIHKWVRAIPQSYHANVSGWGTENHFYWSVGDLTVDGVAYTNVVLRWSVKTGEWAVRSYPSEFRVWAQYRDASGNNVIVAGDDNGCVLELNKPSTYTDYHSSGVKKIFWDVCTFEEDFDYNQIKDLSDSLVYSTRNARGAEAYIKINGGEHKPLGAIDGNISEVPFKENISGNYFQFGLRGTVDGGQAVLKEIEIPNITVTTAYV